MPQVFAKRLADVGTRRVVLSLAVELAAAGQLKPSLEVLGDDAVEQGSLGMARVVEFGFGARVRTHMRMRVLLRWMCGDGMVQRRYRQVLAALARQGRWVTVYYGWRPNLPDEGDNHLIEPALADGALAIVTHNLRDLRGGELRLGNLRVLTPAQCLEEWK